MVWCARPLLLLFSSLENRNKLNGSAVKWVHAYSPLICNLFMFESCCYFVLQRLSQIFIMKTTPAIVCHGVFWVSTLFFFSFLVCCCIIMFYSPLCCHYLCIYFLIAYILNLYFIIYYFSGLILILNYYIDLLCVSV